MACLQISKSCVNSFLGFRSDFGRKSSWFCSDLDFPATEKKVLQFRKRRSLLERGGIRICCRLPDTENEANGFDSEGKAVANTWRNVLFGVLASDPYNNRIVFSPRILSRSRFCP
eukprot:TRINITY_DN2681_c0_g1_i2.p1 TRINITY_DN2681_c0_g1~~TRINITY_DN2681_c0_g1_i2.p1  ORF type:complete len:115 (+),score=13.86 TRINITY_DN2681_c0_g1_i2:82-426(+)